MPYEEPLAAVDVARFLNLSTTEQWQVILRGPLRPPSATPMHKGAAETLAHYSWQVTGVPPHGAACGGPHGVAQFGSHGSYGQGTPAAPTGPSQVAAIPGLVQYYLPHAGPAGGVSTAAHGHAFPYYPHASSWS